MKNRSKVIVIVFAVILSVVPLASFAMPDVANSTVERRSLAQWKSPVEYRKENPGSSLSDYFASLEDYLLDQFPLRDDIRGLSALSRRYLFSHFDQNRFFKVGDHLGKLDFVYREKAVEHAVKLFNGVYDSHFRGGKGTHLFALIPDKGQYMTSHSVYPKVDTEIFMNALRDMTNQEIKKLSLKNEMTIDTYYRTDPHWNQLQLRPLADTLLSELNSPIRISGLSFDVRSLGPFSGTYAGQAALPVKEDELVYLDHPSIRRARVYDPLAKEEKSVYRLDLLHKSMDPYDVFLGGARPVLFVRNDEAEGNRRLVVFRDSFGSSMVPLLVPAYREILVVDLRYVRAEVIKNELDAFRDADVLFLYSTTVLNAPGAFPVY